MSTDKVSSRSRTSISSKDKDAVKSKSKASSGKTKIKSSSDKNVEPYTKPDSVTLKKSAPLNVKLKPDAKPPTKTITAEEKKRKSRVNDSANDPPKPSTRFSKAASKSTVSSSRKDSKASSNSRSESKSKSESKKHSSEISELKSSTRSSRSSGNKESELSSKVSTKSQPSRSSHNEREIDKLRSSKVESSSKSHSSKEKTSSSRKSSRSEEKSRPKSSRNSEVTKPKKSTRIAELRGDAQPTLLLPESDTTEGYSSFKDYQHVVRNGYLGVASSHNGAENSDEEVEESISSRLVEVDDAEIMDEEILDEDAGAAVDDQNDKEDFEEEFFDSNMPETDTADSSGHDSGICADTQFESTIPFTEAGEADDYDDDFEDYDSDFEETDEDDKDENEDHDEDEDDDDDEVDEDDVEENELQNSSSVTTSLAARKSSLPPATEMTLHFDEVTWKPIIRPRTSRSFVNFAKLKEKLSVNQAAIQADSRGNTLLSMIRLDAMYLDIFTLQPINYDAFISSFGLHNTQQVSVQTNDDDLSQEVQTDNIKMLNKWTQQPFSVDVGPNMTHPPTPQDYLGVGGDKDEALSQVEDIFATRAAGNIVRLTKFLSATSKVVLQLLEEEEQYREMSSMKEASGRYGSGGGGFSTHGVLLGGSTADSTPSVASLLARGSVTCIEFSSSDPSTLLTGHSFEDLLQSARQSANNSLGYLDKIVSCSGLVCVWSVHEPFQPRHFLRCHAAPLCLSLCPGRPVVALAGLQDGTVAAWDLREPAHLHPRAALDPDSSLVVEGLEADGDALLETVNSKGLHSKEEAEKKKMNFMWRCRVPSFITAGSDPNSSNRNETREKFASSVGSNFKSSDKDSTWPLTPLIALHTILSYETELQLDEESSGTFQAVSLSRSGELVWWVVVRQRLRAAMQSGGSSDDGVIVSPHFGASSWSKLLITKTSSLLLNQSSPSLLSEQLGWVACNDLVLRHDDGNVLFVCTDTGLVKHLHRLGQRMDPPAYLPDIEPNCSSTCVAVCPFEMGYILVGCIDGSVRLHSMALSRPLAVWMSPNAEDPQPVQKITWSTERVCVFYVHEAQCIHVWDLSAGDMSPVATVYTDSLIGEEGPMVFSLAPTRLSNKAVINAVFGSSTGRLVMRTVDKDFMSKSLEERRTEIENFRFYVNIL